MAEVVMQRPCAPEWQEEWKCLVTICFTKPTDSLQKCLCIVRLARWQSGHAEDCKSLYVGSIPARASKIYLSEFWDSQSIANGATALLCFL